MAQTLGDLITRVLQNCGKASAGDNRDLILADMKDMLRVDLPTQGGHAFDQGLVSLTIGATASVAEDGVYAFPATLRSFGGVVQFVDDPAMGTDSWALSEGDYMYADPDVFYQRWRYGPAIEDSDYGKPVEMLIAGRNVHLRPIPKQTATGNPWWGTAVITGTTYLDTDALGEADPSPQPLYEACLIAECTMLEAARRERAELMQLWAGIAERRRVELRSISLDSWKRAQPAKEF